MKIASYGNYPLRFEDTTPPDGTGWVDEWVINSDYVLNAGESIIGALYTK